MYTILSVHLLENGSYLRTQTFLCKIQFKFCIDSFPRKLCKGFSVLQTFTCIHVAKPQFTVSAIYIQGKLVLTNGVTVEGTFGGKWLKRVEIQKAVLEDPVELEDNVLPGSVKELQYVCMFLSIMLS